MTKLTPARAAITLIAVSLVVSACGIGGGADTGEDALSLSQRRASDVRPPEPLDPERTAQPGMVLGTNSVTWQRLIGAADQPGAIVLFVQPGGPSDGRAIARGDILTEVDGVVVTNHEHAIAVLRSVPGQSRELAFVQQDGTERTVSIQPQDPAGARTRDFLDPMISGNPNDPVLRFLRAQADGAPFDSRVADADRALELDSRFVEAMTLRASMLWDERLRIEDDAERTRAIDNALAGWQTALDVDPQNAVALSVRSTARTALGNVDQGIEDAENAIALDSSYPRGYYALAVGRLQVGAADDTLGPAAAAVQLNPFNAQYWRVLARTFQDLDRSEDCSATADAFAGFLEAQGLEEEISALRSICA